MEVNKDKMLNMKKMGKNFMNGMALYGVANTPLDPEVKLDIIKAAMDK